MKRTFGVLAVIFAACLGLSGAAFAQDVVTLANGAACIAADPGDTVMIPIFVRDTGGTPLGSDAGAGNRIQGLSFEIVFDPLSFTASDFQRGGVTTGLTAIGGIEAEVCNPATGRCSYAATFDETTNPIPFTLNAALPGDQVGTFTLTIANTVTPGSTLNITFNTATTLLSNDGGTVSETQANGNLSLVTTCIQINAPMVTNTCPATAVATGGSGTGTVTIDTVQGTDTMVSLSSGDTGVATVPATVTIPAGSTSANYTITGVAAGTSMITATLPAGLGADADTCTVTVANATVTLTPDPIGVAEGATAQMTATISTTFATSTMVTLMSSATGVATVPASVTIPAGSNSATFNVTGVSVGSAMITATMPAGKGGDTDTATANVVAVTVTLTSATASGQPGQSVTFTVALSSAQGTDTTITLNSSDMTVATVPLNVTIPAGSTSATFNATVVGVGTTTITATAPSGAFDTFTLMGTALTCTFAPTSAVVAEGSDVSASISVGVVQAADLTVTLSSANTGIATVPATVTIPAGSSSASFFISGILIGDTTVTATLPLSAGGGTCTLPVAVTNPQSIPTLAEWMMILLAGILAITGYQVLKP